VLTALFRECQTILDLSGIEQSAPLAKLADQLGAQLFTLCKSLEKQISAKPVP